MFFLFVLVLLLIIMERGHNSDEVGNSKHFYLSDGKSKEMYMKMRSDGMRDDGLKTFVNMEDKFLQLEMQSVHSGITRVGEATVVSNKIKNTFPGYDFSYHTMHLKQTAEPGKDINPRFKK
jgi:hypothetical protein